MNVYRGRILLIGQDRAGKTSLKKYLLGLPFDSKEQSTEGIEIDPSKCEIGVEQIKNWNSTSDNRSNLPEFAEYIARILAAEGYHWFLSKGKEDSEMESEEELPGEEPKVESMINFDTGDKNNFLANQVCFCFLVFHYRTKKPREIALNCTKVVSCGLCTEQSEVVLGYIPQGIVRTNVTSQKLWID